MKRDPINFSINLSARGKAADEIPIEDAAATAYHCLSLMNSLLALLTHADVDRLQQMDSNDLSITFENVGEISAGLCDEALMLIDSLEDERKRLVALTPKKGGE